MKTSRLSAALGAAAVAVTLTVLPGASRSEDWFIPGQQRPAGAPERAPRPARAPARVERAPATAVPVPSLGAGAAGPVAQGGTVQMPAIPQLPPLPRGPTPPAAVIGVLDVQEVMRASTAAQQVEKVLGARFDKLNQEAQKEQAAWNDLQKSLGADRPKLSADQIRNREKELQDRIANATKQFRERRKIIEDAVHYAQLQIQQILLGVIRQVSESRGMNLVLHRPQVALNANEFEITSQVAEQLNKLLPSINIPPDGQEPPVAANTGPGAPNAAAGQAQVSTAPSEPSPEPQQPAPAAAAEAAPAPAPTAAPPSGPARK